MSTTIRSKLGRDNGEGIGAYSDNYPFTLALEFATYFNGNGAGRFDGASGANGLTQSGNHIAFCASAHDWEDYQYHYSATELPRREYLSNGAWKKLDIISEPINDVNMKKPGTYTVDYTYKNDQYTGSATAHVTVLEDKTDINTKNSELYVGEDWTRESNFVGATDEVGKAVPWSDNRIISNNAKVDTSKPRVYNLKYTFQGKFKNVDSEFTVTVVEPLQLKVPDKLDFGKYKLGDPATVLSWDKNSKVEVTGPTNLDWLLTVACDSGNTLSSYLELGDQLLSNQPMEVAVGKGAVNITSLVPTENFLKVDYAGVKSVHKDSGSLEWALTPSTKEVKE